MDKQIKRILDTIEMPQDKKEQTFAEICKKYQNMRKYRIPRAAVAACAVFIAVPTAAIAAEKISSYLVQTQKDNMHTLFNITEKQSETQEKYVKLQTIDLEGYTRSDILHTICFDSTENKNMQGFYVQILKMDGDTEDFYEKNVLSSRETEVNGRKAVYMEKNGISQSQEEENKARKEIAVFYEDYGYVLLIREYGGKGMEEDEFLSIAEKMVLVPVQQPEESAIITVSEYMDEVENDTRNMLDYGTSIEFPEDKMCDINGTQIYQGISYHIDRVEVRDNVSDLDIEKGNLNYQELLKKGIGVDEDYNLLPYERETIGFGDGYKTPELYVAETKTVTPKLVLVTMTITNISWEDENDLVQIGNPLSFVIKQGETNYFDTREFERGDMESYYCDSYPVWISDSERGTDHLLKRLPVGESTTVQLGYFVDEDMLDEMVMEFDFGGGLNDGNWSFIDMRGGQ